MALLFLLFLSFQSRSETLLISLGKARTLRTTEKTSVHVGSKALVTVIDSGDHITLIGKKVGETHLVIGQKTYRVEVIAPSTLDFLQSLKDLLRDRQGLSVEFADGAPRIEGQLLRFDDWQEIADLAIAHHGSYEFAARPIADVASEAMTKFAEIASKAGLPPPHLLIDGRLTLSLPAGADDYLKIAEKTFSPYGIDVRVTSSQVKLSPLIRTHVILAGLARDAERTIGIGWPDSYQAKVLPHIEAPNDLAVDLQALETKGLAKILASPNLLCRSGAEADFLAGGEIPIRTSKFFSGEIQWKKHGVILRVKPQADASGAMNLDIETEVSILDKANAIEGIPALLTNRVHSHFDLAGRRTIALSGLLREDWGLNSSGLAGLSSIPILGALFRLQSFKENKTELVVFVTPEVVLPDTDGDPVRMPEGWATDEL